MPMRVCCPKPYIGRTTPQDELSVHAHVGAWSAVRVKVTCRSRARSTPGHQETCTRADFPRRPAARFEGPDKMPMRVCCPKPYIGRTTPQDELSVHAHVGAWSAVRVKVTCRSRARSTPGHQETCTRADFPRRPAARFEGPDKMPMRVCCPKPYIGRTMPQDELSVHAHVGPWSAVRVKVTCRSRARSTPGHQETRTRAETPRRPAREVPGT